MSLFFRFGLFVSKCFFTFLSCSKVSKCFNDMEIVTVYEALGFLRSYDFSTIDI